MLMITSSSESGNGNLHASPWGGEGGAVGHAIHQRTSCGEGYLGWPGTGKGNLEGEVVEDEADGKEICVGSMALL